LFVAGVLAFSNFSLQCNEQSRLNGHSFRWTWIVLGSVCLWFSVDFESGVNAGLYDSLIGALSYLFPLSARAGEILLSAVVMAAGSALFLALGAVRASRTSLWLFWLGVLSWAGIFATGSWHINEALKIFSATFFLMCFLETMKSLRLSASPEPSCAGMEYNRLLARS
jgi:hypothetical protein